MIALVLLVPLFGNSTAPRIYPQSSGFPLQLYSLTRDSDIPVVGASEWSIGQRYGWDSGGSGVTTLDAFVKLLATSNIDAMPHLPCTGVVADPGGRVAWTEANMANWIRALARNGNVAYWDFPEELRYWKPSELAIAQSYSAYTRQYDQLRRPNFQYQPNQTDAARCARFVPFFDVIATGNYADYAGQPHPWVRWHVEEAIRGVHLAGAVIGRDYLHGQKTIVSVIQLFKGANGIVPTPDQSYHDFWGSIASGAQGIFVASYSHRNDVPSLLTNWSRLCDAASQVTGPEQLGSVILFGTTDTGVTATVTQGPNQSAPFTPYNTATPITIPAIGMRCWLWNGSTYVIAVNSTDQTVTATFANLPLVPNGLVLFQKRSVSLTNGTLTDSFLPWGVNVYKVVSVLPIRTTSMPIAAQHD